MQDYNDTPPQETPQEQPQQSMPHVTNPGQMTQPPTYGQGVFQNPPQQAPQQPMGENPVSLGDWMITMLLMCIPLVNIILLFVWAFGGDAKKSKSNWAKASLIWYGIMIILTVAFYGSIIALVVAMGGDFNDMY